MINKKELVKLSKRLNIFIDTSKMAGLSISELNLIKVYIDLLIERKTKQNIRG